MPAGVCNPASMYRRKVDPRLNDACHLLTGAFVYLLKGALEEVTTSSYFRLSTHAAGYTSAADFENRSGLIEMTSKWVWDKGSFKIALETQVNCADIR